MSETKPSVDCSCGVHLDLSPSEIHHDAKQTIELACGRCGRRIEIQEDERGWTKKGELVPEGSVPVAGFSRELRLSPDVERYWFEARDDLQRRTPVHIVFSPSTGIAEVKHSAAKPMRLTGVSTPTEARRLWAKAFERPKKRRTSERVLRELGVNP
jgi:hypothetical protein